MRHATICRRAAWLAAALACGAGQAPAADDAITPTEISLQPTFQCVGIIVRYTGDANFDAAGSVQYRPAGREKWLTGHPLVRISDRAMDVDGRGARNPRFATSLLYLTEDTAYEVKVAFTDPDGVARQLPPGRFRTRNSKVPLGGGRHYYVDPASAAGGDGGRKRPLRTLDKAFTVGGPGDTVHFAKGTYHVGKLIQSGAAGTATAWLHLQAEPGAVITDADPAISGPGKVKWERFKQDVDKRWIYKADLKNVRRVMVRKTPGDPASGYFLWRFHPKARSDARGRTLQHMIDDLPRMNCFGAYLQAADGLYLTLPAGVRDPARADFQISRSGQKGVWFRGHHVVVDGFTVELTATLRVRSKPYGAHHYHFRRLKCYGKMTYGFWTGRYSLLEDSEFVFNSHWDWITSKPARNGTRAWSKIKNGHNDMSMLVADSHSTLRHNLVSGYSNAIVYSRDYHNLDIHNNIVTLTGDDCIEPDSAFVNGRVFENKLYRFFNGFSDAPVSVGPAFIVRNLFYGYQQAAFKIRNAAAGAALYYHNTCYPNLTDYRAYADTPDGSYCFAPDGDGLRWMKTRNNIFIARKEAYVISARRLPVRKLKTLDLDYNCLWALSGRPSRRVIGEKHSIRHHPKFVDLGGADLRLKDAKSPCVDAGEVIPGINDQVPAPYQYKGQAPDLGAYEHGSPLPHYGPRPTSGK